MQGMAAMGFQTALVGNFSILLGYAYVCLGFDYIFRSSNIKNILVVEKINFCIGNNTI